jgi:hypothetical protein
MMMSNMYIKMMRFSFLVPRLAQRHFTSQVKVIHVLNIFLKYFPMKLQRKVFLRNYSKIFWNIRGTKVDANNFLYEMKSLSTNPSATGACFPLFFFNAPLISVYNYNIKTCVLLLFTKNDMSRSATNGCQIATIETMSLSNMISNNQEDSSVIHDLDTVI